MISRVQIRHFLAVVDSGSFTRAAELIHVTQPSLSSGVAELERQLGTKLLIRDKKRIQLTEAGSRFLVHARRIQREFRLAEEKIGQVSTPAEPLRLGLIDTLASALVERIVCEYLGLPDALPLIVKEGREAEIARALSNHEVDAALTILDSQMQAAGAVALVDEPYVLMVPDSHPIAGRGRVAPEEVSGEIMIARRSCEVLVETSKFFTSHGIRPPFSLRSPNDDRVLRMVRAGLGITVAPLSSRIDGVSAVELATFDRRRTIGFAWLEPEGADMSAISALRGIAQGVFRT
ncbi:LysR family transcriptional regulator [Pacificimonas sp. ICDLI1SI03]